MPSIHTRPTLLLTATLLLFSLAGPVMASDAVSTSNGLTAAGGPLAIHGYDALSYRTPEGPRRGLAEFSKKWNGAVYRFASRDNLQKFSRNPEKYAPQFGGFCAYGVSVGKKFDGDPEVYKIVDGRLFFNLNPEIKATWEKDLGKNIQKAEKQWPKIRETPAGDL